MLTDIQIEENKQKFINLLKMIEREGADIDRLINKLSKSDFFYAPASTQYHNDFKGGLCLHSLNVYSRLYKMVKEEYPETILNENGEIIPNPEMYKISNDSVLITALLHDISKMNFYETSERNTKDEKGNWIKVPFIKVKENQDRFLFGNHESTSLYMIEEFIPLTLEESVAILNHMGGKATDSSTINISPIYNKYPLATWLHISDMLATFIDERLK